MATLDEAVQAQLEYLKLCDVVELAKEKSNKLYAELPVEERVSYWSRYVEEMHKL